MSESHPGTIVTLKTETPDAGSASLTSAFLCWAMAAVIVIGSIVWLGFPAAIDITSRDFNPLPFFFVVCFAFVGTFFLVRGVLHTVRYRKYGTSALELHEPRLGQTMKATVRTARDLQPLQAFKVRLRCDLHTSMRTAKGGWTSSTDCLWESFQSVPAATRSSAGIPIEIAIPENGVASGTRKSTSDSTERVAWALEISAPLRGVDYYAEFPLTVGGRRRASDEPVATDSAAHPPPAPAAGAFAGYAAPRSRWSKMFFMPFLIAGMLLAAAGAFTTWKEITRSLDGVRETGRITQVSQWSLEVALDGAQSPITAQVALGSNFFDWQPGTPVKLTCRQVKEDTRSCRLDTRFERWINTLGTVAVGLVLLALAWAFRPPPKQA